MTSRERVYQELKKDPHATLVTLAKRAGLKSRSTVSYHLDQLELLGRVRKVKVRYEIVEGE